MRLSKTPITSTAFRPGFLPVARIQPAYIRLASTGPGSGPEGEVGDKGTAKVYNKDGTNPNKNLIYAALGALGIGGVYAMSSSKPEKVAEKAQANAPPAR
ncbi:hypothetical protein C8A01DRAFT_18430 [Parachaetomium inaequale]|uniref:Uncharacterized protein n=1 Tax=Parachaetomium inaequale TaxID=2588326 RepID=A0AAN6PAL3_9PEZI|nr:hypothetical protein C8A01DRAFT_18430 [Parachaetomium inaequale]